MFPGPCYPRWSALAALLLVLVASCSSEEKPAAPADAAPIAAAGSDGIPQTTNAAGLIRTEGPTIETRFVPPQGYERAEVGPDSFAAYLRRLPLKPSGARVRYYHRGEKDSEGVYVAVVDFNLGRRDLQQCADAVIRLRAEYLYAQGKYDQIHFNFLSDGRPRAYLDRVGADRSYAAFLRYLDFVFERANTASLAAEMTPVRDFRELRAGDVFIQPRRPYGHAVIVVDLAVNAASGKKVFLLAQSYMPAQDIQVLVNPNDPALSPWYAADFEGPLLTPQWTFEKVDLKRF